MWRTMCFHCSWKFQYPWPLSDSHWEYLHIAQRFPSESWLLCTWLMPLVIKCSNKKHNPPEYCIQRWLTSLLVVAGIRAETILPVGTRQSKGKEWARTGGRTPGMALPYYTIPMCSCVSLRAWEAKHANDVKAFDQLKQEEMITGHIHTRQLLAGEKDGCWMRGKEQSWGNVESNTQFLALGSLFNLTEL